MVQKLVLADWKTRDPHLKTNYGMINSGFPHFWLMNFQVYQIQTVIMGYWKESTQNTIC